MMGLNAIFPHLVLTVALKKYCPGLMTGLWLNLPLSLLVVIGYIRSGSNAVCALGAVAIVSGITLVSLKHLFRLGRALALSGRKVR